MCGFISWHRRPRKFCGCTHLTTTRTTSRKKTIALQKERLEWRDCRECFLHVWLCLSLQLPYPHGTWKRLSLANSPTLLSIMTAESTSTAGPLKSKAAAVKQIELLVATDMRTLGKCASFQQLLIDKINLYYIQLYSLPLPLLQVSGLPNVFHFRLREGLQRLRSGTSTNLADDRAVRTTVCKPQTFIAVINVMAG